MLPLTARVLDLFLIVVTMVLAVLGREVVPFFPGRDVSGSVTVSVAAPVILVIWVLAIAFRGGYATGIFGAGPDEFRHLVNSSLATAAIVGIGCYLASWELSRGFFGLTFLIGTPLLVLGRVGLRRAVHRARRGGSLVQRTLIVGSPEHVDGIAAVLTRETWLGYQLVGALSPAHDPRFETPAGIPIVGNVEDVADVVESSQADVLFIVDGAFNAPGQMRQVVWDLEPHHAQVIVAPSVTEVSGERVHIRPVGGLPLVHLDRPRSAEALRWAKRAFDAAACSAAIVVFAPVLLFTALRIKMHDGGPVLFRQPRVGRDGSTFTCLKFRSMVINAEEALAALHERVGYEEGLFKMKDDPRITKPGHWIRRFSIDELPQLFNVLRGDMSLVGPRPPLQLEVDHYTSVQSRRLRVRPGMTGLWQVSGRSDLSWSEAVRLDLYYVDNWSMVQDLSILFRTVRAVLSSRGAY
ncbi:MAG: sugar transferase [Nocardioides sp.]